MWCDLIWLILLVLSTFPYIAPAIGKSFRAVFNFFKNFTSDFSAATDQIAAETTSEMIEDGKIPPRDAKRVQKTVKLISVVTIVLTFCFGCWFLSTVFSGTP